MDTDAEHIASADARRIKLFQSLVANNSVPECRGRGRRKNVKPAGSDYRGSERHIARVDEMHVHPVRNSRPARLGGRGRPDFNKMQENLLSGTAENRGQQATTCAPPRHRAWEYDRPKTKSPIRIREGMNRLRGKCR